MDHREPLDTRTFELTTREAFHLANELEEIAVKELTDPRPEVRRQGELDMERVSELLSFSGTDPNYNG